MNIFDLIIRMRKNLMRSLQFVNAQELVPKTNVNVLEVTKRIKEPLRTTKIWKMKPDGHQNGSGILHVSSCK